MALNSQRRFFDVLRKLIVFTMLADIMLVSRFVMALLPNIHILAALVMIYTIVYRTWALIPIYMYVILEGLFSGFSPWWIPYLYVWTILWGITMLLPKKMPPRVATAVYITIATLHGLLFGIMYAPTQALIFGYDLSKTMAWIASGFPFDILHSIGNFVSGFLILPLSTLLIKLEKKFSVN